MGTMNVINIGLISFCVGVGLSRIIVKKNKDSKNSEILKTVRGKIVFGSLFGIIGATLYLVVQVWGRCGLDSR